MNPPDPQAAPDFEMRWAAFLLLHSNDIRSHADLFMRILGLGNEDDDRGGGPKRPTRPRQPTPLVMID